MWVLECSGDDLKGKKLWIRPGKRIVFGRTISDEIGEPVVLSHKTVSRKHLIVEAGQSGVDDCCDPNTRSKVFVKDLNTKIGTLLNDGQIRGQTIELKNDKNSLILGRYEKSYCINWIPVTLTFSFTIKEHKVNPYTELYRKFGPYDIKILVDYVHEHTTHVVAKKRNTAKGLQALIGGKYIVHNDTFVDALALTISSEEGNPAPLEIDFDGNFPNPIQYLPPKGDEPTQRDEKAYVPNKIRKNIFNGYSFVFYEEKQYQNLLPVITYGSGKAFFQVAKPRETNIEDFAKFVKSLIAKNEAGNTNRAYEENRVIVVRFIPVKSLDSEWYAEFGKMVALRLNNRLVEQNEFLDAILANDASILWRPLQIEDLEKATHALPSTNSQLIDSVRKKTQPSSPPRVRTRRTTQLKFKGFDDDFSGSGSLKTLPSYIVKTNELNTESPRLESSICQVQGNLFSQQDLICASKKPGIHLRADKVILKPIVSEKTAFQSPSLFVSQDPNRVSDEPELQAQDLLYLNVKETSVTGEDEIHVTDLMPENPNPKRRSLNNDAGLTRCLNEPFSVTTPFSEAKVDRVQGRNFQPESLKTDLKKNYKQIDIDVEQMLLQKREKKLADSRAKAEIDSFNKQLDDINSAEIRNKIQVEEMQLNNFNRIERSRRPEDSNRWNDLWNGRKNFKKFRRQGMGIKGVEKVIVKLKEVKKEDLKISDELWGDDFCKPRNTKNEIVNRTSQESVCGKSPLNSNSGLETTDMALIQKLIHQNEKKSFCHTSQSSDPKNVLSTINAEFPTLNQSQQIMMHKTTEDQYSSTMTISKSLKRVADPMLSRTTLTKKPRLMSIEGRIEESDDESEDEFKFRFKKKV